MAFIAGAAVGALAAILVAPDSGKETRKKIKDGAAGVAGTAKEKILEGLDVLENILEEK